MGSRFFDILYAFVSKRRWLTLAAVLCVTVAALIGFRFIPFSSSIESMLPEDPEIARSMEFLKNSKTANKIVISLALNAPDKDKRDLFGAADMLADSLTPPLFTKVIVGLSELNMAESMGYFTARTPYLLTDKDMESIDALISRERIADKMRTNYLMLLKPEGMLMGSMLRSDPLGLNVIVLNKLKSLSSSLGYSINVEDGHFISRDGRHALLIAQTTVSATDTLGSRKLFDDLEGKLKRLPGYISADIISGHSHSLSNERVLKRDISLTSTVATIIFALLFLVIFADVSAVLIFLIPLFAIFQSIYLCNLFLGNIAYAVVGLSTILAGISIDYGIHVYIAVRRADRPAEEMRKIAGPIAAGALTTFAVFFSFLFSSMEGYRQLGYMAILGIVLSLIYFFLILPHFRSKKKTSLIDGNLIEDITVKGKYIIALWAIPTVVLLFFAMGVRFDSNIYKIDGTEPEIFRAEERFHQVWGSDKLAMLVTTGDTLEQALEKNDVLYREASPIIGERFTSLSTLMPSEKTARENGERWQQFWADGRAEKLQLLIDEEGVRYGFSGQAFAPFFKTIAHGPQHSGNDASNELIEKLKERFIQKGRDGYQVLSFFPDEARYVDDLYRISKRYPGTFLVSPRALSGRISTAVYSDILLMTAITAVLVILLTYIYFRNVKELLLAMVPVVTSIIWLFGIMSIAGILFNLSTLITGIALMGLCVDYGIFMVYRSRTNATAGVATGVFMAALTTCIGTGVLILAKHPALFNIGITMTVGIVSGYLSSLFVVPYLYRVVFPKGDTTNA